MKRRIEINDELLELAARILGTSEDSETVRRALAEVVEHAKAHRR